MVGPLSRHACGNPPYRKLRYPGLTRARKPRPRRRAPRPASPDYSDPSRQGCSLRASSPSVMGLRPGPASEAHRPFTPGRGGRATGHPVARPEGRSAGGGDTGAGPSPEGVLGEARVAEVVESVGNNPGEPDALVERADGLQPGIAGELAPRRLDDEWRAEKPRTCGQAAGRLSGCLPDR